MLGCLRLGFILQPFLRQKASCRMTRGNEKKPTVAEAKAAAKLRTV